MRAGGHPAIDNALLFYFSIAVSPAATDKLASASSFTGQAPDA
jgi:hypothetical protein